MKKGPQVVTQKHLWTAVQVKNSHEGTFRKNPIRKIVISTNNIRREKSKNLQIRPIGRFHFVSNEFR